MIRKLLVGTVLALAALGATAGPALAGGSVCLTTTVTVNGTPAPTNGTNCSDLP